MAIRFSLATLVIGVAGFSLAPGSFAQGPEFGHDYIDSAFYTFDTDGPTVCGSNENPSVDILMSQTTTFSDVTRTGLLSCDDEIDDTFGARGFGNNFDVDRALELDVEFETVELDEFHFAILHQRTADGPTEGRVTYSLDFGSTWIEFDPFSISTDQEYYEVYLCFPPQTFFALIHIEARGGRGGALFIDDLEMAVTIFTPVELTRFEGVVNGSDAALMWQTASETNNAGFEVQMRADGVSDYHALGFVEGHGTTTEVQNYTYTISNLHPGTYAFRLKQIDFDGAFEYSDEIEVTIGVPDTHLLTNAYPNPFNPQARFSLSVAQTQNVNVSAYDALGRRVLNLFDGVLEAGSTHPFVLDGQGLATGLLIIRAIGETFAASQSVTLLR